MNLFKSTVAFVVVKVVLYNSPKRNKTIFKIYNSPGKQQKVILVLQKWREHLKENRQDLI